MFQRKKCQTICQIQYIVINQAIRCILIIMLQDIGIIKNRELALLYSVIKIVGAFNHTQVECVLLYVLVMIGKYERIIYNQKIDIHKKHTLYIFFIVNNEFKNITPQLVHQFIKYFLLYKYLAILFNTIRKHYNLYFNKSTYVYCTRSYTQWVGKHLCLHVDSKYYHFIKYLQNMRTQIFQQLHKSIAMMQVATQKYQLFKIKFDYKIQQQMYTCSQQIREYYFH
eukprot:TRINITY_DN368_c1_g1_i4.p1 TRINITY_DN368_c1_g1~~TRINITY_DN368_c1_g1_i4.p1  ORF type:complete len:225 (-),score=-19.45 TRINITY_DN368_c1_g1_i4:386-1060(-)